MSAQTPHRTRCCNTTESTPRPSHLSSTCTNEEILLLTGLWSAIEWHRAACPSGAGFDHRWVEPGVQAGAFGSDHTWAWLCVRVITTVTLQLGNAPHPVRRWMRPARHGCLTGVAWLVRFTTRHGVG